MTEDRHFSLSSTTRSGKFFQRTSPTLVLLSETESLSVLAVPRSARPKALNAGIAAASAPVIGILDDDNLYDRRRSPDHFVPATQALIGNVPILDEARRHVRI